MRIRLAIACVVVLGTAGTASAQEGWTGPRQVTNVGCHLNDGTCWAKLTGATFGPAACDQFAEVRWNQLTTANGRAWLTLFTAAQATGTSVHVYVQGCFASQPQYPTFIYGIVGD